MLDTCVNTRDNGKGAKCADQLNPLNLNPLNSCQNYLLWKDCDMECKLCACSTGTGTKKQHCSGHGKCEAVCTKSTCSEAKCRCNKGWIGIKCDIPGSFQKYTLCLPIV